MMDVLRTHMTRSALKRLFASYFLHWAKTPNAKVSKRLQHV
jgi:hypothetical protein